VAKKSLDGNVIRFFWLVWSLGEVDGPGGVDTGFSFARGGEDGAAVARVEGWSNNELRTMSYEVGPFRP